MAAAKERGREADAEKGGGVGWSGSVGGERQWNARKRREIQNVDDGRSTDCEGGARSTAGNVSQINYPPAFAAESTILYDRVLAHG